MRYLFITYFSNVLVKYETNSQANNQISKGTILMTEETDASLLDLGLTLYLVPQLETHDKYF